LCLGREGGLWVFANRTFVTLTGRANQKESPEKSTVLRKEEAENRMKERPGGGRAGGGHLSSCRERGGL